jgi:hypothetical protein
MGTLADDGAFDAIGILTQVREVGKHQVNARHIDIREHETDIDQQ